MADTPLFDRLDWAQYLDTQRAYRAASMASRLPDSQQQRDWAEFERRQAEASRLYDSATSLKRQLIAGLRPDDVSAMLDAVEGDAISSDQRAIVFVLNDLVRGNDPRMPAAMRDRWAQSLEHKMTRSYPDDGSIFSFLNSVDSARARASLQSVVSRLSLPDLPRLAAEAVIHDVKSLGASGLDVLRQLSTRDDEAGPSALRQLERLEPPPQSKIDSVASRWRKTGTRDDLNWIYNTIISRWREGQEPIDRLLAMLGEPSQSFEDMMVWNTREPGPIGLMVGFDSQRMIVSYKLK